MKSYSAGVFMATLVAISGCGGGDSRTEVDASSVVDGASPDALVLSTVFRIVDYSGPVNAVDVIVSRPDGTLSTHLRTDGMGEVSAEIGSGYMVTVATDFFVQTWTDLTPGMDIEIPIKIEFGSGRGSVDVGGLQEIAGADVYIYQMGECRLLFTSLPPQPHPMTVIPECLTESGRANVVVTAIETPNVVGISSAIDVELDPSGTTPVTLTDFSSVNLTQLDVTLTNPMQGSTSSSLLSMIIGGQTLSVLATSAATSVAGTFDSSIADLIEVQTAFEFVADGLIQESRRIERILPTAAHQIDVTATTLPPFSSIDVGSISLPRPSIAFSYDAGVELDLVRYDLNLVTPAGRRSWVVFANPSSRFVQFPELPNQLALLQPTAVSDARVSIISAPSSRASSDPRSELTHQLFYGAPLPNQVSQATIVTATPR